MQFHIFIIELQYQYLNYITGIPLLYKILKTIHNTGINFYTSDRQVQEIRFVFNETHLQKIFFQN
jgi:predicted nucleic acid-binding protein